MFNMLSEEGVFSNYESIILMITIAILVILIFFSIHALILNYLVYEPASGFKKFLRVVVGVIYFAFAAVPALLALNAPSQSSMIIFFAISGFFLIMFFVYCISIKNEEVYFFEGLLDFLYSVLEWLFWIS